MRPTFKSKSFVRCSAVVVAAVLLHSYAAAATFKTSLPCPVPGMREAILQKVNAVRARGYNCGGQSFGSARPVSWNGQLESAAALHSSDMASNNYFSHVSLKGTRAQHRVDAQGYKWSSVGENIAAGDFTVDGVMQGWLNSPLHCSAIMDPGYVDMAVACVSRPGTTYGDYWTMVFGRR